MPELSGFANAEAELIAGGLDLWDAWWTTEWSLCG